MIQNRKAELMLGEGKKGKSSKSLWQPLLAAPALFFLAPVGIGLYLTHPLPAKTRKNPKDYGLEFEEIEFFSRKDQVKLSGWWIPAASKHSKKTVITAHGYMNERAMEGIEGLRLAKVLSRQGYNLLMFDFRNAGKSKGRTVGLGYYEKHDLYSAIEYAAEKKNQKKIALLGWSMGAATALIAGCEHPAVSVIIADSPFSDLEPFLKENLSYWTKLPKRPFTPIIYHSMRKLLNIDPKEVSPINKVASTKGRAILLIHSKTDEAIPFTESERLYQSIPFNNHKELWLTEKAKHIHSYFLYRRDYELRILRFLNKHLRFG
ncbi:alpha/beta hydrolase [Neobacillus sp. YIM B02564]|uniref:Alpha/beta hydrolase n=2 Tax=Neobacillus TaxID=2675232 RepID=A0ABS1TN93_9BACI|nr:alpha/beta hydrolase [Neobacillus paridis]MBL4952780.1 alpha/beta hydrolase [Neobacillus paridis]